MLIPIASFRRSSLASDPHLRPWSDSHGGNPVSPYSSLSKSRRRRPSPHQRQDRAVRPRVPRGHPAVDPDRLLHPQRATDIIHACVAVGALSRRAACGGLVHGRPHRCSPSRADRVLQSTPITSTVASPLLRRRPFRRVPQAAGGSLATSARRRGRGGRCCRRTGERLATKRKSASSGRRPSFPARRGGRPGARGTLR